MHEISDTPGMALTKFRLTAPHEDLIYRGEEMAQIVDLANRSHLKPAGLSNFAIAPVRHDVDDANYAQVSARDLSDQSGLEFRFHVQARGDVIISEKHCADYLITAACLFEKAKAAAPASEIRAAVDRTLQSAADATSPMRVVAIGITPADDGGHSCVTVDVEALGDDLTLGIERVVGGEISDVELRLAKLVAQHVRRDQKRSQAIASGTFGWLDGTVARLLDASGLPQVAVVDRLRYERRFGFAFTGAAGRLYNAALYWKEGVIQVDLEDEERDWSLTGNCLMIRDTNLPLTIINAWKGRRIGKILEHEFIPRDAVVTDVPKDWAGWLELDLAVPSAPLDSDAQPFYRSAA